MLQGEHSAILSTFIKLPFVIIIFVLSVFEWPLKTGLTVSTSRLEDIVDPDQLASQGFRIHSVFKTGFILEAS